MQEAKTLVHMAITAMFGAIIISAALGLVYVGYNIWSLFSKQEQANMTMKEHAQLSAFDNTEVRGQDVLSLILETQGDPFVLVYQPDENDPDEMELYLASTSSATTSTLIKDMDFSKSDDGMYNIVFNQLHDDTTIGQTISDYLSSQELIVFDAESTTKGVWMQWKSGDDLNKRTAQLQNRLMNTGKMKTGKIDTNRNDITENTYGIFNAHLVYDAGDSSDIIGVILTFNLNATLGGG